MSIFSLPIGKLKAIDWLLPIPVVAFSAALLARVISSMDRGFDFTDQSFYLMLAQKPQRYDIAYGLFGYGLHPLYELAGGSISTFQRLGILIFAILGFAVALASIKIIRPANTVAIQLIATATALPAAYYMYWLPSPSYNWFALVAGLVLAVAIISLHEADHRFQSAIAAAFAAVVLLFTRPENAAAYGIIYFAAICLVVPTIKGKFIHISMVGGLTAVFMILVASVAPIGRIVDQIQNYMAIFGTDHPIKVSFIEHQIVFLREGGLTWFGSVALFSFTLLAVQSKRFSHARIKAVVFVCVPVLLIASLTYAAKKPFVFGIGPAAGTLAFCALSFACIKERTSARFLMLLGLAALIPWAATFGSAGRTSWQSGWFSGLWGIIFVITAVLAFGRYRLTASIAALGVLHIAIATGLASPYRLAAPIEMQVIPTQFGWGSELKLDQKTSEFVLALRTRSKESGFCQGDSAIDLSGALPGAVFAMGGRMPVFPWIFAGYPFSDRLASEVLKRVEPAVLSRSWLITSDTPGSFSIAQLASFGINFDAYRLVAELHHPVDGAKVKLYAPRGDQSAC